MIATDSQIVKIVQFVEQVTGIDGNKKINGRKRHIAVDSLGLPWSLIVTAGNVSDSAMSCTLLGRLKGKVPRLKLIAADHGYKASFIDYVSRGFVYQVEKTQKPDSSQGFVPQKHLWQVELSFGWLNFRRLFRDVEKTVESLEAMLQITFIEL